FGAVAGEDSAGVVTSRELYIVWCLVDGASFLNPAMWLMDHLDEVTRSRGDIAIGGMITIIASSFGLDLTGQQVIPGSTRLDLKAFQTMGWIGTEVTAEGYVWKVGQRPYAYLPNPERTVIYNPENWLFAPDFSWVPAEDQSGEPSRAPELSTQADDPPVLPYAHQLEALRGDIGSLRTEVQLLHQSHSDYVAAMQRSVDVLTSQHQAFQATFGDVPELLRDLRAWHISQGWTPGSS
ncbi:hypothetical protein BVRB_019670, partial [Beta vulgaris subsp. vulgaris]